MGGLPICALRYKHNFIPIIVGQVETESLWKFLPDAYLWNCLVKLQNNRTACCLFGDKARENLPWIRWVYVNDVMAASVSNLCPQ